LKILVTGCSGLLGSKLTPLLARRGYNVVGIYNVHRPSYSADGVKLVKLDITNTVALEDLVLKEKPDVIIHAAAYTDVDGCERDKNRAWRINVEATKSLVRTARVVKSYIIYISTDYIFDGSKGDYIEGDTPCPINYYGLTKLIGEELVRGSDLLHTIVRPSAIYGLGGSKKSFAEYIVEKLMRNECVKALTDQYVSPTYNGLLAKAIAEIVELRPMGVLHIAGPRMNRYEFALKIAKALDLPLELVKEASMKEMTHWIACRPRDSSLDTSKAKQLLKTRFYDVDLAVDLFKKEWLSRRGEPCP